MFNPFTSETSSLEYTLKELQDKLVSDLGKSGQRTSFDVDRVSRLVKDFHQTEMFKPGDIVQWKPGMKVTRIPDYGERAVVVEMVEPLRDGAADGVYRAERYDMRLGAIAADGDFISFLFDSRRFQKSE